MLYKYVDALCGTTGAGALINLIFLARLGGALETIYFNDLDYIFGSVSFLARAPSESYAYNPMTDLLTAAQWDEVRVKDAWYRARVKSFFIACSLGGTPDGLRQCVDAAVAVDADLYEVWRYEDNFGLGDDLGRAPWSARNEVVVRPHKASLMPVEMRLLRDMLNKIAPVETIITVNLQGLAVSTPVPVAAAASDSEYYEVQKVVTPTPVIANLPPPELLPIDLLPTETWLYSGDPTLAPYAAFNITQEYGYYYLVGGGQRSPIDSVTYGTLQADGSVQTAPNYEVYETSGTYTDWINYEKADSPDNFPGGKWGIHPNLAPPLNPDGTPYIFAFLSQVDYITDKIAQVIGLGGIADDDHYKMPITPQAQAKIVFYPEEAVAYSPPAKESTVTQSVTRTHNSPSTGNVEPRNPVIFVRSS